MKFIKIKRAFTLAEVLITLAIIGVVAAMTIPTMITKIQDWQFKQAAKEAYSKASQAVAQMRQDNGGDLSYYGATTHSFFSEFKKYFKSPKDCASAYCVKSENPSSAYKNFIRGAASSQLMDDGQFISADGIFWGIENSGPVGWIGITVDVNGYENKPNQFGKDVFMFQIVKNVLYPMGAPKTYFPANTHCAKSNDIYQGLGCMYNVMQGIDY